MTIFHHRRHVLGRLRQRHGKRQAAIRDKGIGFERHEFARLVHKTVRRQNILEISYDAVAICDHLRARRQKLYRLCHRPSSMPFHQLVLFLYHFETAQSNDMDFFHSGNNQGQL
ncbi:hypothetical protein D3C86_1504030 [compost metagenome]